MTVRVLSYNIWDLPLWFVKDRKNRMEALASYLAETGVDILCIQESWDIKSRFLFRRVLEHSGYHYAGGSERHAWTGNGGVVTFSKFPIMSKKFSRFTPAAGHFIEMFTGRGVLEIIVKTPEGLLRILNTHLHMPGWFRDQKIRLRQLQQAFASGTVGTELATVFAGDFNEHDILNKKGFIELFYKEKFNHPLTG
jgi:endonuclease/exonuclease/phosphatase family metal-dependent hydrolase